MEQNLEKHLLDLMNQFLQPGLSLNVNPGEKDTNIEFGFKPLYGVHK